MRESIYKHKPFKITLFLFICFSCSNEQTIKNSSDSVIETSIFNDGFCLNSKSTNPDDNIVFTKDEIPYSLYCYLDYMVETFIYHTDYSEIYDEGSINSDSLKKWSEQSDEEFFNDPFFTNSDFENNYVIDTNTKYEYDYETLNNFETEEKELDTIKYGFLFSKGLKDRNASFYFENVEPLIDFIYNGHKRFYDKTGYSNLKRAFFEVKPEWIISLRKEDLVSGFNIEKLYKYDSIHVKRILKSVDSIYRLTEKDSTIDSLTLNAWFYIVRELVLQGTLEENVALEVNYKVLIMLFHELGHAYQYTHLNSQFKTINNSPEKKYILELHADYIMGTFLSRYIKAYITNKVASNKETGVVFSSNFSIDFEGKLEVYKFIHKERLEKINFHREFMNFGDIVFKEMLIKGDNDFGNSQHHGRNVERAKAFLDGYQDAYYSDNNFIVSHKKIEKKLINKINNYESIKNRNW